MTWFVLAFCVAVLPNTILVDWIPKGPAGLNLQNVIIATALMILLGTVAEPKAPSQPHWPKLARTIVLYLALAFAACWYGVLFTGWVGLPAGLDDFRLTDWRDELTGGLMFFLAAKCIKTEDQIKKVLVVLVIASAYFVGYYLVLYYPEVGRINALPMPRGIDPKQWDEDKKWMIKALAGVFVHLQSNEMAAYYLYVGMFFTGLFWHYRSAFWRILVPIEVALLFLGVVYSASRGAMLSAAAAVAYSFFRKQKWLVRVTFLACAAIPAFGGGTEGLDASAATRLELWNHAFRMGLRYPLGVGYRLFSTKHKIDYSLKLDTHNFFMRCWAELGPGGFLLMALFFLGAIKLGWILHDSARSDFSRGMGRGCALMWASAVICNLFGDRLSYVPIGVPVWTLTGLTMALLIIEERDRIAEAEMSLGTVSRTSIPVGAGGTVPVPDYADEPRGFG
ncbi:MAG: O-antigen ligase family protein [Deltaproteobacteria bacterium]|nr:O-antigen ligase family protein [Deltaproteobacteria bacterium]